MGRKIANIFLLVLFITNFFIGYCGEPDSIKNSLQFYSYFEENLGQFVDAEGKSMEEILFNLSDDAIEFNVTTNGATILFKENAIIPSDNEYGYDKIKTRWSRIDIELINAKIDVNNVVKTKTKRNALKHYYIGNDQRVLGVQEYSKLVIKEIYPHIDWVLLRDESTGLKHEFHLHPGANPEDVKIVYHSKEKLEIDENGNAIIKSRYGKIIEHSPVSYIGDKSISSSFELIKSEENCKGGVSVTLHYKFDKEDLDDFLKPENNNTLIIDPYITWSTLFAKLEINELCTDSSGELFVIGNCTAGCFLPLVDNGNYFEDTSWVQVSPDAFISKFDINGVLVWSTCYGVNGQVLFKGSTFDKQDNLVLVGANTVGPVPYLNSGGYFETADWSSYFAIFSNDGILLKASSFGNFYSNILSYASIYDVEFDSKENMYICGGFNSNLPYDFPTINTGGFYQDSNTIVNGTGYIAQFDSIGNLTWCTLYLAGLNALAIDSNDNLIVVGSSASPNTILYNGGNYYYDVNEWQSTGIIAKFDTLQNMIFATRYHGIHLFGDVDVDKDNNIFLAGEASIDLDTFDNGTYYQPSSGGGVYEMGLIKMDELATPIWVTYFGGNDFDSGGDIELDKFGNLHLAILTGSDNLQTSAGCGSNFLKDTLLNYREVYYGKFSNDGDLLESTYYGGDTTTVNAHIPPSICSDEQGNIYLAGKWPGLNTANYIPPLINPGNGAYYDTIKRLYNGFISKFSNPNSGFISSTIDSCNCNGTVTVSVSTPFNCGINYVWSNGQQTLNTMDTVNTITGLCQGYYTVTVSNDNGAFFLDSIYVGNLLGVNLDLGQDQAICDTSSYIIDPQLSPSYSYLWQDNSTLSYLNVDSTGTYSVAVDIGSGCILTDSIIVQYAQIVSPDLGPDLTICYEDSVLLGSPCSGCNYLWSSGTQDSTFLATQGDTIILQIDNNYCFAFDTIIINELPPSYSTDTWVACDSFTWINGITYTTSNNTAQVTFTNDVSCDSIVTLDLTIYYSSSQTDSISACDSYTWIDGNTYTSSTNTPTWTLTSSSGCDSVVTLDLTINYSSAYTETVTSCGSYTWMDGNTYSASTNVPTWTLVNSIGCDSIVTLDLTVNNVNTGITQIDDTTLQANALTAQYQWLDCDSNFSVLNGETNQFFDASVNGSYAVEITENGCVDTSACLPITSIGIIESDIFGLIVSPNPTVGEIHINLGREYSNLMISVYDASGKVILESSSKNTAESTVLIDQSPGVYTMKIIADKNRANVRVIKQ